MDHTRKAYSSLTTFIHEKSKKIGQHINNALGIKNQDNSILVLDGLRAIACLSVLFFHFRWLTSQNISRFPTAGPPAFATAFFLFGNSGVILFFLLSGFLLFLPFAKALLVEDCKWPSLRRFYLRRIFRIVPGYYISLMLLLLFFHPEFLHLSQWRMIVRFLTFSMNYNLAQQINGVFWTLAIEFQFYLLLPLIAWVMSLFVRRGAVHWRLAKLTLCLLVVIGWGLATRFWALYIVDTTRLDWLLNHSVGVTLRLVLYGDLGPTESGKYFEVFGLGMLLCAFYVYSRNFPQTPRWNSIVRIVSLFFGLVGLSGLAFLSVWNLYFINLGAGPTLQPIFYSYQNILFNIWPVWRPFLIGLAYALCMFTLLHGPKWLKHPFEALPLRWLGTISYSLYIWHMPLALLFFGYFFSHNRIHIVEYILVLLWVLLVTLPFSMLFYRYIERSGIRLGESILHKIEKQKKKPDVTLVKKDTIFDQDHAEIKVKSLIEV